MAQQTTTPPEQLNHGKVREIFERAYHLLNEHDVAHIPAIFTEDVVFEDDASPDIVRGYAEMERFLGMTWTAFPDIRFQILRGPYLDENGGVAVHMQVTGTMKGPLDPPGFAPSGARVSLEYGGFYELEGDRISRARIIMNMNEAGTQIGALPPPGSVGEKAAVFLQRLGAPVQRRRAR